MYFWSRRARRSGVLWWLSPSTSSTLKGRCGAAFGDTASRRARSRPASGGGRGWSNGSPAAEAPTCIARIIAIGSWDRAPGALWRRVSLRSKGSDPGLSGAPERGRTSEGRGRSSRTSGLRFELPCRLHPRWTAGGQSRLRLRVQLLIICYKKNLSSTRVKSLTYQASTSLLGSASAIRARSPGSGRGEHVTQHLEIAPRSSRALRIPTSPIRSRSPSPSVGSAPSTHPRCRTRRIRPRFARPSCPDRP